MYLLLFIFTILCIPYIDEFIIVVSISPVCLSETIESENIRNAVEKTSDNSNRVFDGNKSIK